MPWQPMHIEFFLAPAAASPASAADTGAATDIRPRTATVEISREGVMSCFLIMDLPRAIIPKKAAIAAPRSTHGEDARSGQNQRSDHCQREGEIGPVLLPHVTRHQR